MELTQKIVKELYIYDPETGELFDRKTGKRLGHKCGSRGAYLAIHINRKTVYIHRIAFLYWHGRMPDQIDHRNGISWDNRIENIREANYSENGQNRTKQENNTSGYMGVSWDRMLRNRPWKAVIKVDGKYITIGRYVTPELAHEAYCEAKRKFHPFQPTIRNT